MTAVERSVERMTDNVQQILADIVTSTDTAILTTVSADGSLHSRPLAVLQKEFDGSVYFLVQHPTEKTAEIAENRGVNVSFSSKKGYLSLAGTASIGADPALIDELWTASAQAWFPEGREDPTISVITVEGESAEYWALTEPGVFAFVKATKAILTGGTPDIGENDTVRL
ncbi:general stress protein [Agromyces atrinae]|uniref:General stress protein n=2 Tax=Agromyces atrinae TaxID=592376 RepID=A0A4Q2M804_9MICO|nr:general stress protein [Agromyces atrinae]